MKKLSVLLIAIALITVPIFGQAVDTRGLLCPACKVIIDYAAVEAAAGGIEMAARTVRLRSAAHVLSVTARGACDAEKQALTDRASLTRPWSQAQFDRAFKLWKDSCDRATQMRKDLPLIAAGQANEATYAALIDGWTEEMTRVPRELAEGKVPK